MAAQVKIDVKLENDKEVLEKLTQLEEKLNEAKSLAKDLAKAVESLTLKV